MPRKNRKGTANRNVARGVPRLIKCGPTPPDNSWVAPRRETVTITVPHAAGELEWADVDVRLLFNNDFLTEGYSYIKVRTIRFWSYGVCKPGSNRPYVLIAPVVGPGGNTFRESFEGSSKDVESASVGCTLPTWVNAWPKTGGGKFVRFRCNTSHVLCVVTGDFM